MNILYLADPNSIHDIKWMSAFSDKYNCYLISRKHHLEHWSIEERESFYNSYGIKILGYVEDFSIRKAAWTLQQWRKIQGLIANYNIDIFHIMYAEPNALWCVFKQKQTKVLWVLTTRGTDILKTIPGHIKKKDVLNKIIAYLYKLAINKFDKITCTSQLQIANAQKLAPSKQPAIIRTGVDIDKILSDTSQALPAELIGKKYIFFPRIMRPIYNHEFSINAISLLPGSILREYHFVFLDKDGTYRDYIQQIDELMKANKQVNFIFLNRQSQTAIWEMYKQASLVVMNPISDGAPVSAMEAMVCSVPVIVSNLPYDPDIFEKTVFKLMSWDPAELSGLMEQVLTGKITIDKVEVFNRIKGLVNRTIEMQKLDIIYKA